MKALPDSGADAREVLNGFARWPTWMWANEEVVELAEWLRRHNDSLAADRKVGFYQTTCIQRSKEIDQDTWRRRGTLQRWGADFAKLLRPLL